MPVRDADIGKLKKKPQNGASKNAREAALGLLHQLFQHPEDGTPLPVMLGRTVEAAELDARNAAFLSELTYGVLRRAELLDVLLAAFLKKPNALSPLARMLLRMGLYEILFMDGIPSRASVSEYVSLARKRLGQGIGGLVNGVLRSADRESETLRHRVGQAEPKVSASVPSWLMSMWEEQYGAAQAAEFALNTLEHAAPCWRVNMAREGAEAFRKAWLEKGYAPVGEAGFTSFGFAAAPEEAKSDQNELAKLEIEGALSRQGVSSQRIAEFIATYVSDEKFAHVELWDACCGRGGKSAALLEKGVRVSLASDPSLFRINELKSNIERLGLPMPRIECAPMQEVEGAFPLILLDVPCSGTGTLGRVPELRLRLSPERLAEAEKLQESILAEAWNRLLPGGKLFYVTCALNRRENDGQIERFLRAYGRDAGGDASLVEQRLFLPDFPGHDALFLAVLSKA